MKPALLVIDVQKAFFHISEEARKSLEQAVAQINAVVPLFREKNLPVVWIQHRDDEYGIIPGVEGISHLESLGAGDSRWLIPSTCAPAIFGW